MADCGDTSWTVLQELKFHRCSIILVVRRCSILLFLKYLSMNTLSPLPFHSTARELFVFYYGMWNSLYW